MTKETLKESLKIRFGDKYLEFMQDFSNISFTAVELGKKWGVNSSLLCKWCKILGYSHSFSIKQDLRSAYRIARRVKARQETARQILSILQKRQNVP